MQLPIRSDLSDPLIVSTTADDLMSVGGCADALCDERIVLECAGTCVSESVDAGVEPCNPRCSQSCSRTSPAELPTQTNAVSVSTRTCESKRRALLQVNAPKHASCSQRNFMRTFGRRMQGKPRTEFHVSSAPLQQLDHMNLGEVVDLSLQEKDFFKCRDVRGRIVDGVFASPVVVSGSKSPAVAARVISSRSAVRPSEFPSCSAFAAVTQKAGCSSDRILVSRGSCGKVCRTFEDEPLSRTSKCSVEECMHLDAGSTGDRSLGSTKAVPIRRSRINAYRTFEEEVNAWHRPRAEAARAQYEERDRLYRQGKNPGHRYQSYDS